MAAFLCIFMTVYGAANLYVFRWVKPAFGLGRAGCMAFLVFTLTMFALSMLSHALERHDHTDLARIAGLVSHMWMLFVLWIVSFGLTTEVWNALIVGASRFHPAIAAACVCPRRFLSGIAMLAVLLSAWGLIEANSLALKTVTIRTARIPRGTRILRILQVSDLHLDASTGNREIDRLLKLAKQCDPDLMVCTGDAFDSTASKMESIAARLVSIQAPLGKLAVFGNHEHYRGEARSLSLLQASGFRVLNGESVTLPWDKTNIVVAGVDDARGSMTAVNCRTDEQAVLPAADSERPFVILLKHQPVVSALAAGRFDLQLSGHTHGGQIFPFHIYVRLFFSKLAGLCDVSGGAKLYVSRGVGTWGLPLRVLARPEITLFVIRPASDL